MYADTAAPLRTATSHRNINITKRLLREFFNVKYTPVSVNHAISFAFYALYADKVPPIDCPESSDILMPRDLPTKTLRDQFKLVKEFVRRGMLVKKNAEDLPPIVKKEYSKTSGARKTATRFGDVTVQRLVSLRSAGDCRVRESGIDIQKRSAQAKNARRVDTQGGKGVGGAISDREEATSTAGDMETSDRASGEKGPARDAMSDPGGAICDREEATSDREEATSTAGDMEDRAPGEKGPAREASAMREDDDGLVGMEGSGSLPQYTGGCEDLGGPLFDGEGGPSVAAGGVHSALKRNVREFSPNRWDRVADD